MTTLVFGHKSPDTDATGSAIIWAWFLSHHAPGAAEARVLGTPNTEAQFVLTRWGFDTPALLTDVEPGQKVVIVDTNNPAELPPSINQADIRASSTTTNWWAGWKPQGRLKSPSGLWPAPPR